MIKVVEDRHSHLGRLEECLVGTGAPHACVHPQDTATGSVGAEGGCADPVLNLLQYVNTCLATLDVKASMSTQ